MQRTAIPSLTFPPLLEFVFSPSPGQTGFPHFHSARCKDYCANPRGAAAGSGTRLPVLIESFANRSASPAQSVTTAVTPPRSWARCGQKAHALQSLCPNTADLVTAVLPRCPRQHLGLWTEQVVGSWTEHSRKAQCEPPTPSSLPKAIPHWRSGLLEQDKLTAELLCC